VHAGFFGVLRSVLGAEHRAELDADEAALDVLLSEPAALRDLRFRRIGDRMATWIMLAGMKPVPALDAARAMSLRHVRDLPVDEHYVATVAALQRV
jgi:hypothetical protein